MCKLKKQMVVDAFDKIHYNETNFISSAPLSSHQDTHMTMSTSKNNTTASKTFCRKILEIPYIP